MRAVLKIILPWLATIALQISPLRENHYVGFIVWSSAATISLYLLVTTPEVRRRLPRMKRSVAVAVVTLAALAGYPAIWLLVRPPDVPEPQIILWDRYAESWGAGVSGERLLIYEGMQLETTIGKLQMFSPAINAPDSVSLSNVWFNVCVPLSFQVQQSKYWELQDRDGCARYSTVIPSINRGTAINPREALHFQATETGEFPIFYAISSRELPTVESSFVVVVTR